MNTLSNIAKDVYFLLLEEGFSYMQARFVVAQAAHETANFTSKIFLENNNLFGMKLALVRKTTATGQKNGHATYTNLRDCVKDFTIYYNTMGYLKVYSSVGSYVAALKKKAYFEADQTVYETGVNHFYNLYYAG
jgi:uncharacterized FlgJ-related protein